jgi:MFS family permease
LNLHDWVVARIAIDLDPLRESRDFRLLFAGQMVSMIGSQFTVVALAFQVYTLTRSSLQVGAVSLVQLVPFVSGSLVGGSAGDALDRRRILLVASSASALTSGALVYNATSGHGSVLLIYLVSAVAAGLTGVVSTTCSAVVPALVGGLKLTAAYASMQVVDQVGMVVGPAVAGVLIGSLGLAWVYALDAVTFLLSALAVFSMSRLPPSRGTRRPGLRSIIEGFAYLRGRQALQGAYLVDLSATVFGLPRALFPAVTHSLLHRGPSVLGLLYAAPAAGALFGALTSRWLERIRYQARLTVVAVWVWGAAIVAFGLVRVLWISLALLVIAGFADVISAVLRSAMVQTSVSAQYRSRISSIQMAVVEGGPRLGDLEAGAVAAAVSTQFSVVVGGIACIAGALGVALSLPGFRNFTTPQKNE